MKVTTSTRGTPKHRHGRDWRPCPWTRPDPLTPTKAVSRWMFEWAQAIQHHETMVKFVNEHPVELPRLAGKS